MSIRTLVFVKNLKTNYKGDHGDACAFDVTFFSGGSAHTMEPFRVIVEIAGSIIVALGGGGAIVFGLSSWLGKVWADRLMQKEKATHDRELEDFKVQALRKLEEQKAHFQEKIALYKEAITPVVEFITEYQLAGGKPPKDVCVAFEKKKDLQPPFSLGCSQRLRPVMHTTH
jgi:hypothetical protein